LIRARIDEEKQFALPYELVIVDPQIDDGPFNLGSHANQIGEHLGIVCSGMMIGAPENDNRENDSKEDHGDASPSLNWPGCRFAKIECSHCGLQNQKKQSQMVKVYTAPKQG
jgi:membrane protease subunit (stomatin/prohibitin family)